MYIAMEISQSMISPPSVKTKSMLKTSDNSDAIPNIISSNWGALPHTFASYYNFPTQNTTNGKPNIAIVSCAGLYRLTDLQTYWTDKLLRPLFEMPTIHNVFVDTSLRN